VRHLIPVHFADNAFGGYALGGSIEKRLFELNSMAASEGGLPAAFLSKTVSNAGLPIAPTVALPKDEDCSASGFDLPCNARGLTTLGTHLITSMMNKGMIIDIDHMSKRSTDSVLVLTSRRQYPVVGGHTGFVTTSVGGHKSERDKSPSLLSAIKQFGGMVSVGVNGEKAATYVPSWRGAVAVVANDCDGTSKTFAQSYLYAVEMMGGSGTAAVGLATDQFMTEMPRPRFGNKHCPGQANPVTYPITAHMPGVTLGASRTTNREWDYNTEGLVHFGLLPDFIQDLKNDGLTDQDLAPLFRSAEGYIRMWERAVASVPVP
ncbi:MAG: membrane dipeptidase, partial [Gemmatimonadota bacterium]|nr:membrane dipeptidase [Gemmatimonadota bacterium]